MMDFTLFVGYLVFISICFVLALYQTSSFYIFGKMMDMLLKKKSILMTYRKENDGSHP